MKKLHVLIEFFELYHCVIIVLLPFYYNKQYVFLASFFHVGWAFEGAFINLSGWTVFHCHWLYWFWLMQRVLGPSCFRGPRNFSSVWENKISSSEIKNKKNLSNRINVFRKTYMYSFNCATLWKLLTIYKICISFNPKSQKNNFCVILFEKLFNWGAIKIILKSWVKL